MIYYILVKQLIDKEVTGMADENMEICPLMTGNTVIVEGDKVSIGTQPVYCVHERCAWWNEDKQKCAIAVREWRK